MKTTLSILCLALTGSAFVIHHQDPNPPAEDTPAPPYVVQLAAMDEADAERLSTALRAIPGVEEVEAFPGKQRSAHLRTADGHYVSHAQVAAVVQAQELELENFEVPQWAKMRLYVVEASGGG